MDNGHRLLGDVLLAVDPRSMEVKLSDILIFQVVFQ